jgi:hypothetical protein
MSSTQCLPAALTCATAAKLVPYLQCDTTGSAAFDGVLEFSHLVKRWHTMVFIWGTACHLLL